MTQYVYKQLTGSGTYVVGSSPPPGWQVVAVVGARAYGAGGSNSGGGGAFAQSLTLADLITGTSCPFSVGVGGTNSSHPGGSTWFNATSLANAYANGPTVSVAAQGGGIITQGDGGLAGQSTGTTKFSGGNGGASFGGGGGCAGPNGAGANGASGAYLGAGGGGGAASGGSAGGAASGAVGGAGGNAFGGTPLGGAGASGNNQPGGNGGAGAGGGGGSSYNSNQGPGGNGGSGVISAWIPGVGPGGGGGAGGDGRGGTANTGGAGGNFGGGGGQGNGAASGTAGNGGLILKIAAIPYQPFRRSPFDITTGLGQSQDDELLRWMPPKHPNPISISTVSASFTIAGDSSVSFSSTEFADGTFTIVGEGIFDSEGIAETQFLILFPPAVNTSIQNTIPSYLYVQYNDDDVMQGMVAAYNAYTQAYLNWFNSILLPIYTNGTISGLLLDWVANGLYGIKRPTLPSNGSPARGPFNTYDYNSLAFNAGIPAIPPTFYATSDDTFKRIITWRFYKADGHQFNVRWLKRRIFRFLNGLNGTDFDIDQTYDVSIDFTGPQAATITVPSGVESIIMQEAILAGVLELPFQIDWTVVVL